MDDIQKKLDGLPGKSYFRIGEVARITRVKPYVLRFWESEFKMMTPPKSRSKQRMYRKKDIEMILKIKQLLYAERFTIEGASKRLSAARRAGATARREEAKLPTTAVRRMRNEPEQVKEPLADP